MASLPKLKAAINWPTDQIYSENQPLRQSAAWPIKVGGGINI
jgi:hypothetical protein